MSTAKAWPGDAPSSSSEPPDSANIPTIDVLRMRGAELEAVIDGTPFMLARLGRDMCYRFISRAYARTIAREVEDVIGKHAADVLGEEGFAAVRPYIEKVLHGEPAEYELEIAFPGLGPRLMRGFYTPVFDEAGKVDGWIASLLDIGEERRADEVRRQLASIVDSSGDAIFSEDLDGIIVSWNRGAQRLYGYSAREALGQSIALVIPPELRDEEPAMLARIARGEHIENYETLRRCKNGRLIEVSLTVSPVRDAAGRIVGASKIARDITERRLASRALAQREEEQKALYEFTNRLYRADSLGAVYDAALDAIVSALHCSRASILRFDEHFVMRFVAWRGLSERYRRAVEGHSPWSPDETNPEPVCLSDAAGADLPPELKKIVADEGIGALAFIPIAASGKLAGKFMAYYEAPHTFTAGEVDLALNLARQLGFAVERMQAEHARRAAEQELRELSERLETEVEKRTLERDRIWNVSEDLLGVSNFEGYFISINPAWTRLLGWSEQEIKSTHVNELRHPDDAAHSLAARAQLVQGVPTIRMENRLRHKDGSWRWISWTMTAENGLIYIAGRHVTVEKEAAAALEQAQRQAAQSQKMEALGQLTGGVAHDFNNLLMIVSGHAQRLHKRLADPRDVRSLEAIQIAATRGESLTRQLLSFSRAQPLNPTVLSPAETVNGIRDVLSGSLHVNIALAIDVAATIWPVRVDKSEIELALVNLVLNARDAMPEGGKLSISAENVSLVPADARDGLTGEFVALRVADTGCGIPHEILAKVFEPFFTTKAAEKGTGLGLSQVYGFARRSGGTVAIASEVGRGTTFSLYLPRSHGRIERPPGRGFRSTPRSRRGNDSRGRRQRRRPRRCGLAARATRLSHGRGRIRVRRARPACRGRDSRRDFHRRGAAGRNGRPRARAHAQGTPSRPAGRAHHRLRQDFRERARVSGVAQALSDRRARAGDPLGARCGQARPHRPGELSSSASQQNTTSGRRWYSVVRQSCLLILAARSYDTSPQILPLQINWPPMKVRHTVVWNHDARWLLAFGMVATATHPRGL
jgi:PAS domain S-box-containing protein